MMKHVDVLVVGGGIVGASLLYAISNLSNVRSAVLLERGGSFGLLNTGTSNNSQTLHRGDIESNYSYAKAVDVRNKTDVLINYAKAKHQNDLIFKYPKMLIGVGDEECELVVRRYESLNYLYTNMELMSSSEISTIEPHVTIGRNAKLNAIVTVDSYSTADFKNLADAFIIDSIKSQTCVVDVLCDSTVVDIDINTYQGTEYNIVNYTKYGTTHTITSDIVIVCAGAHSLVIAKKMGFGGNYSCLPISGSFYRIPPKLNGKVYTVQDPKLPFAAIHGDNDLYSEYDRIGPTAFMLPVLRRYGFRTIPDFLRVFGIGGFKALVGLMKDKKTRDYMLKNMLLEIPFIREGLFLGTAQKIIPTLKRDDLEFASGIGGIRPVLFDNTTNELAMGDSQIDEGCILFNTTPSPGASVSLSNAIRDLETITSRLGFDVDSDAVSVLRCGE